MTTLMTTTSDHLNVDVRSDIQIDELKSLVERASATSSATSAPAVTNVYAPPAKQPTAVNKNKPELPAYLLSAIALIGIVLLTFHGNTVPEVMNLVAIGALGIGGAVTQTPHPPTTP